jgi:DNA-directed RNA polymerase delta subunit
MKLKDLSIEDLEVMSHKDIAYYCIKESKKSIKINILFKNICDLLGNDEDFYKDKIADFYTSLTLDKRFVLLEDATWDLREHHSVAIEVENDENEECEEVEEEVEEEIEEAEEIEEEPEEDNDPLNLVLDDEIDEDELEDELADFSIITEEELE